MKGIGKLSLGKLTALFSLGAIGIVLAVNGPRMFSPGALNGQSRSRQTLQGASSHADLSGNCSACHVAPWSAETMTDRCLTCHTDVRRQIDSRGALHGKLPSGTDCRGCHTEHKGSHGHLTDLSAFDHSWTGYPLTGKHVAADCARCHKGVSYKVPVNTCVSCHAEPAIHAGKFGVHCAQCHTTNEWEEITFVHRFPIRHGERKKTNACLTCHASAADYRSYSCTNCHEHERSRMVKLHQKRGMFNIDQCATCHPTGLEHETRRAELGAKAKGR